MVAPATGRPGEEPYECDAKSFLAGFFAGRGIKGRGEPDIAPESAVPLPAAQGVALSETWRYDNKSFKLGLALGIILHVPGQGMGD